jgi:peptidoglycan/LPS O-acetylase OafA/YrhL
MSGPNDKHLPEIDGLRALAILSVLMFHLDSGWLPGGFLGVDMFFVISGFLITRLIVTARAENQFSFRAFYLRRAWRLLPAFLVTLLLTWIVAWQVLFPLELKNFASTSMASLLSLSNYQLARGTDYFSPDATGNPLLHTWSLAVEEQFYLLYPMLLVLGLRGRAGIRRMIAAGVVTVLFVASVIVSHKHGSHAFYGLEGRAWELAAGCFTAALIQHRVWRHSLLSWLGLALCIASLSLLNLPAVAVLSTVLLIATRAGGPGSMLHGLLVLPPVRYLGRMSYSLYLVHWPLFVLYRAWKGHWDGTDQMLCAAASVIIAAALHHGVENPLRRTADHRCQRWLVVAALVLVTGLMITADQVRRQNGFAGAPAELWLRRVLPDCDVIKPAKATLLPIGQQGRTPEVFLMGDSHAQCLVNELHRELLAQGRAGQCWVAPATLPAAGVTSSEHSASLTAEVLPQIAAGPCQTVILCASWSWYLKPDRQPRILMPADSTPEDMHQVVLQALTRTITLLTQAGKQVILLYPIPTMGRQVPQDMARALRHGEAFTPDWLTLAAHHQFHARAFQLLGELEKACPFTAVHPEDILQKDGRLPYRSGGLALYEDNSHLSGEGARHLLPGVLKFITPKAAP